jgi:isochorismatase family protein
MPLVTIEAEPRALVVELERTALIIIDMQRDFLEPGGFGEALGNDVASLATAIEPCRGVLDAARRCKLCVIHTREGHRPDLSDVPPVKLERGEPSCGLVRLVPWAAFSCVENQVTTSLRTSTPGAAGVRRHHRGVCQYHRARGQRSRLSLCGPQRLLVFSTFSRGRTGHDQGTGRYFRLGLQLPSCACRARPASARRGIRRAALLWSGNGQGDEC